ncbi:Crp/Fnr family transcriptional regulator [Qipengyuania aurantiaca]|uniref:Crp/Fnr family transcriptional regulator n=1 Tax=Qipengyuania aurantiaca TaxID=2867233 RepID=A0ABX8ZI83_9SPHN|nr:Crp/Fnr family transcriptional regulator [Qipengyuania aurantiaca]QZD88715.1 Crp/Fnr family transcriptional regulator [Qipengyuania aurantiaca]
MSDNDFQRLFAAILDLGLPKSMASRLRAFGREIDVKCGTVAEFDETSDRFIVFVAKGVAKLVGHLGNDREQIVALVLTNDLIMQSRTGTVPYFLYGITDCRLLAFPADAFIRTVAADPDIAKAIFDRMFVAFDQSRDMSVLLGRKTAQERVASFLSSMADRIGNEDENAGLLSLPISRREIADSLGLTIETVSRQFTELRQLGVIDTNGRSEVKILDRLRIRKLAALPL